MSIEPGSTIGIIGGGQLGKMLAVAAAQLGYTCHIFEPGEAPCAAAVAAQFTRAAYSDVEALRRFADSVDVATYEFENVPAASLEVIASKLRPGVASLKIGQERALEKEFIESTGATVGSWVRIDSEQDALEAERRLGTPLVLKTRRLGYDGKGQARIRRMRDAAEAFDRLGGQPLIYERFVDFTREVSLVAARDRRGGVASYPLVENEHENGILAVTRAPYVNARLQRAAERNHRRLSARSATSVSCASSISSSAAGSSPARWRRASTTRGTGPSRAPRPASSRTMFARSRDFRSAVQSRADTQLW